MAQRATGFARRTAGTTRAAEKARAAGQLEGEPVPLDLPTLVAPFKRHRGLSIRIENLAHGARLSEGRNNGDRSWSLAPDELDGCEYLPPNEFYDAHTLSVRIVSLDGGDGETLAVLDLPIKACGRESVGAQENDDAASAATTAELQRLRDELVKAKSTLAARETDLAATKRTAEALEHSRQSLKAEFASAELAWDRELREQLEAAAAEAQANLAKLRAEWEAEQQTSRKSRTQAQQGIDDARKRAQQEAQTALAKAQIEWKIAETGRLSAAEASWREQSEKAFSELRAESEKALAEMRARAEQAEAAHTRTRAGMASASKGQGEVRDLREQVSALQANLSARDAEVAEARSHAELARKRAETTSADLQKAEQASKAAEAARLAVAEGRWKEQRAKAEAELTARLERVEQELREARGEAENARMHSQDAAAELKRAERAWKAAEVVRIAGVEARWKDQTAKAVADLTSRLEHAERTLAEARAEAEARQRQLATAQSSLATRDGELAKARTNLSELRSHSSNSADEARARQQQELDAALAEAQARFKLGEATRLAAAETKWKAQFATTAGETAMQLERAESALLELRANSEAYRNEADGELRRVRGDLAAMQNTLVAREAEIGEARDTAEQARVIADRSLTNVAAQIEKARNQWKKESEVAFRRTEETWRNEETPRLAAAEAKLREQVASEMQQANERTERAEAGLAEAKLRAEALRHELGVAQDSLAAHEFELADARARLEQDRHSPLNIDGQGRKARWQEDEEDRKAQFRRRLFRDFAVVACLAALTFMLFPRVQPVVAEAWPQSLSLKSDLEPLLEMAGLSKPLVAVAPGMVEKHATVNVRAANLRQEPSTAAAVLTKLSRNAEVTPVERRGKWVRVRFGEGLNQKQGWVSSSVLQDTAAPASSVAKE